MQVSLREFELFVATMELGTLTAAAGTLGMSQPAASKLLKTLEYRLGIQLFLRRSKKLVPTQEAFQLYPSLQHTLNSMEAVKRDAASLRAGQIGEVHIVTNPAVAANLLPTVLRNFRQKYPGIIVVIKTRTTIEISDLLSKGRADVGVIYESSVDQALAVETISEDEIGCLLPVGHALANQDAIQLKQLRQETVIALGKTQPVGAALRRLMKDNGLDFPISVEVSQSNTACSLVKAGVGVAVLDTLGLKEGAQLGLTSKRLLPSTSVKLQLVHSVPRKTTQHLKELAQLVRDECSKL